MWIMSEKSNDAREHQPAKAGIKSLNAAEEFGFAKNIYIYIYIVICIYNTQNYLCKCISMYTYIYIYIYIYI